MQVNSMRRFLIIFITAYVSTAEDRVEIRMVPSTPVHADTFKNVTTNQSTMILFWSSEDRHSKMYKTSKWDMLASEKDKHVQSTNVTVGNVDCGNRRNVAFCRTFAAFDVTNMDFPYIGVSYFNEPFQKYNGSMEYPALIKFINEHFDRQCSEHRQWCTDDELKLLDEWEKLTLAQKLTLHTETMRKTENIISNFNKWTSMVRESVNNKTEEMQELVRTRDDEANLLYGMILDSRKELVNLTTTKEEL